MINPGYRPDIYSIEENLLIKFLNELNTSPEF